MSNYLEYFFDHSGQLLSIVSVGLVWVGFSALGALFGRPDRVRALDPLVGWAWLGFVFTALGVFFAIPFSYLSLMSLVVAIIAGIIVWRRDGRLLPSGFLHLVLLALPLIILVSAMRASQWDEFPHWLMIPRYMLETDFFPSSGNPYPQAYLTGYPFSWHFVTYLASRVAGRILENAGALTNVFLLLSFGLIVAQMIARGSGQSEKVANSSWFLIALGGAIMFLANPTLTQKIVFTSYAETSSAVALGAAVVVGWLMCEALIEGETERAKSYAWQMGALLALLINLKQATMVLVALVLIANFLVVIRDRQVRLGQYLLLLPRIALPAILLYFIWRYHVSNELAGRELSLRPFDEWFFPLIPEILIKMLVVLSKKGFYLALIIMTLCIGLRGYLRSISPLDRFAAITAMVILGYNAFLFLAYLAAFGKFDALRAASFWRYNMHLGPTVIAFSAYSASVLWRQYISDRWDVRRLRWLPAIALIIAPFVFAKKIRFDKSPMVVHYRNVGASLPEYLNNDDRYFIFDPLGSGESSVIVRYELGHRAKSFGRVSAFDSARLKILKAVLARPKLTTMIVFSMDEGFSGIIGQRLNAGYTYLLRREELGPWRVEGSWPKPNLK